MSDIDISREAVERLVRDTWDASSSSHVRRAERTILALRAALDHAEANTAVAYAARVAARRLTSMQVSALLLLQKHGTPVTADTIRCRDVWYARDVLDRLVKRSLVRRHDFTGGVAPLYEITGLGRAAITEAKT